MANAFYLDQLQPLVGGRIVGLASDADEEFFGLQIEKDGVTHVLWFQRDDEGNGPGSFSIDKA